MSIAEKVDVEEDDETTSVVAAEDDDDEILTLRKKKKKLRPWAFEQINPGPTLGHSCPQWTAVLSWAMLGGFRSLFFFFSSVALLCACSCTSFL